MKHTLASSSWDCGGDCLIPFRPGRGVVAIEQDQPLPCGSKTYCREMTTCEEARFYLNECQLTRLDGDSDGVPCEAICR